VRKPIPEPICQGEMVRIVFPGTPCIMAISAEQPEKGVPSGAGGCLFLQNGEEKNILGAIFAPSCPGPPGVGRGFS